MLSSTAGQGATPAIVPEQSILERMAATMQEMRAAGQVVTAYTLAVFGDFTDDEVATHGPEAANLARSRAVKRVA